MSSGVPVYQTGDRHVITLAAGVELAFRYIPPGEFRMGSRGNGSNEEPVHRVRIPRGFWLGETPVTQGQFAVWTQAHEPEHKNEFPGHPDHPAENMDWPQAVRFCRWLTEWMGAEKQFPGGVNLACLPTEAEWEYACRAGTDTNFFTGDGVAALAEVGRFAEAQEAGTRRVRQGAKNAWGLYDLHGHVAQWCHDFRCEDSYEPQLVYRRHVDGDGDPGAAERWLDYETSVCRKSRFEGSLFRVLRGGSWFAIFGQWCSASFRDVWEPAERDDGEFVQCSAMVGFRLCLAPGPAAAKEKTGQQEAEAARGSGRRRPGRPESKASDAAGAGVRRPGRGNSQAEVDLGAARLPRRPREP